MSTDKITKYTHRYLARIVIEAETPLSVGSGGKDLLTDALVAADSNGLPYIPGTSIAGVFRSMMKYAASDGDIEGMFGFQGRKKDTGESCGKGSEVIFTEAKLLDSDGRAMDGMFCSEAIAADSLLRHYASLPVRQHVRIGDKGTAANQGLFSGQVVFAGSRFCFEVEMVSDGSNFHLFESLLGRLYDVSFRLGGGSRDGFGKIRVVQIQAADLDLCKKDDLDAYLDKSSALDSEFWKNYGSRSKVIPSTAIGSEGIVRYRLELRPESFFQFGSGYSDDEADMTPVKASKVEWSESDGRLSGKLIEDLVLIPATSIKGALAHRVAFHWNRHKGIYSDDIAADQYRRYTGNHNDAVRILFGSDGDGVNMTRGNVIFSDMIQGRASDKIFNHLKIDRFTGGGIEGALFSEKAVYGEGECYATEILIDKCSLLKACCEDVAEAESVIRTFEKALDDLCNGMLPLGGGVNRGHGVFNGKYMTITDDGYGKN